jgi:hypothetical protein
MDVYENRSSRGNVTRTVQKFGKIDQNRLHLANFMKILDLSAGRRAIWFNKNHPLATYLDKRPELTMLHPSTLTIDTTLPWPQALKAAGPYDLVVWDPPHMNVGPNSKMAKAYGTHTTKEILDIIHKTAINLESLTTSHTLMALKWNDHDIKLSRVFALMPQWEPLFGHLTKDGSTSSSQTYWCMLKKAIAT